MKVYSTKNYNMFKTLNGNRQVLSAREAIIRESIKKNGWISNPIICNENYEVIDGQGRLAALKSLGLPVEYIIVNGTNIDDCRALNAVQKNWTINDWIESYVQQGITDYQFLRNLQIKYGELGTRVVGCAANDGFSTNTAAIKNGTLKLDEMQYERACYALDKIIEIKPFVATVSGRIEYLYSAIIFILLRSKHVDKDRLVNVLREKGKTIAPVANIESTLLEIERIYNFRNRGELVNFRNEYTASIRERRRENLRNNI